MVAVLAGLTVALASAHTLPAVAGYIAGRASVPGSARRAAFRLALLFVLGTAVVDAALGGVAGLLGEHLFDVLGAHLVVTNLALATLLLVIGVGMASGFHPRVGASCSRPGTLREGLRAFALGLPFGLAACPTCIPLLLPLLGVAALSGQAGYGALLLFAFAMGRGVPALLAGTVAGQLGGYLARSSVGSYVSHLAGVLVAATGGYYAWLALRAAGYV